MNVLLPDPVAPTIATIRPGGIVTSKWSSTSTRFLVPERHLVEAHRQRPRGNRGRTGADDAEVTSSVDLAGEHRPDAVVAGDRPRQVAEHEPDQPQRPHHEPEERDEADDVARSDRARRHTPCAEGDEQDRRERRQGVEHRVEARSEHRHPDVRVAQALGFGGEPRRLRLLGAERLDHDHAVDALVHHVGHVADEALRVRGRRLGAALVDDVQGGDRGEEQQGDETEHPVGREHPDRRDDHEHHGAARVRERAEHLRRGLRVGLHVGEQLAGRVLVEVRERLVLVAVDDVAPQDRRDAHLGATRVDASQHDTRGAHGADDDQRDHAADDRVSADMPVLESRRDDVVDDPPEHERLRDRAHGEDRRAADRDREGLRLRARRGGEPSARRAAPSRR